MNRYLLSPKGTRILRMERANEAGQQVRSLCRGKQLSVSLKPAVFFNKDWKYLRLSIRLLSLTLRSHGQQMGLAKLYTKKTSTKSVRKKAARAKAGHRFYILLYKDLRVVKYFMLLEPPVKVVKQSNAPHILML